MSCDRTRKILPKESGARGDNLVKCSFVQFPPEAVREIAQLLAESDLGEVSFEAAKGQRLTIKRKPKFVGAPFAAPAAAEVALEITETSASSPVVAEAESGALIVASSCVGVFHAAKIAVEVGSPVKAKQLIGIVESLKVPNDIHASAAGVISQVWVGDGQGVEWGQPLFEIVPGETSNGATVDLSELS